MPHPQSHSSWGIDDDQPPDANAEEAMSEDEEEEKPVMEGTEENLMALDWLPCSNGRQPHVASSCGTS